MECMLASHSKALDRGSSISRGLWNRVKIDAWRLVPQHSNGALDRLEMLAAVANLFRLAAIPNAIHNTGQHLFQNCSPPSVGIRNGREDCRVETWHIAIKVEVSARLQNEHVFSKSLFVSG